MKYVKYILMFFIFYSLSGCYTQLALNGNSDYSSNGNNEEYSNEEYAYEDTTAEQDTTYYGNEGEESQSPEINNYYYFDNGFWPNDFYRRYYWGYYPGVAITIGGGDFYDWYWDNLNWYNWDYYDPYFYDYYYNPYYVWDGYYDGYYNGGLAPVYKYRSRNLTRLRNTHGGRGLALSLRALRNLNRRTATSSVAANRRRNERSGRDRNVDQSILGSRPTQNGVVNGLSRPTVNRRQSSVRRNGRSERNSSEILRKGREGRSVGSRKGTVRRTNPNAGRKVRKENPRVERHSRTDYRREYKAPRKTERRYEPKSRPRSYSRPKSESRHSYYHPQSRESYPSHSSYTHRSYSPSSRSSYSGGGYSRSSGSSGRSSRSSSRGSSSRRR